MDEMDAARAALVASSILVGCGGGTGSRTSADGTSSGGGSTTDTGTASDAATTAPTGTAASTGSTGTLTTGSTTDATDAPTWHQDIAPVIHGHCQPCHTGPTPLAGFSLLEYPSAAALSTLVAEVTADEYMPPFPADETDECHPRFAWKGDLRLNDDEKALLAAWAAAGAPEGDPAAAAPLPGPPESSLPGANLDVKIAGAWPQAAASNDMYRCFSMDAGIGVPSWITGVEVIPGNAAIVHHVAVLVDPSGTTAGKGDATGSYDCFSGGLDGTVMAFVWAPGTQALEMPENSGLAVPVGARIVMQIHYHSNAAKDELDDSTIARLRVTDVAPMRTVAFSAFGVTTPDGAGLQTPPFVVPAGAVGHVENYASAVNFGAPEVRLWSVWPHMHLVGTDMKIDLYRNSPNAAQPPQECLVQTPHWDFHAQRNYIYDLPFGALPTIRQGDGLTLRCTYDNNVTNAHLVEALLWEQGKADPDELVFADVFAGESSLEEMCAVLLGVVY